MFFLIQRRGNVKQKCGTRTAIGCSIVKYILLHFIDLINIMSAMVSIPEGSEWSSIIVTPCSSIGLSFVTKDLQSNNSTSL